MGGRSGSIALVADLAAHLDPDHCALDRDLFCIVEQDMYPVDFDLPKPIAQRTYDYLRGVGIGQSDGTGGERR